MHTLTLQVTDDDGDTDTDSVEITVDPLDADPPDPPPSGGATVDGISPSSVPRNAGLVDYFTIAGTGFAAGVSVAFENGSG